MESNPEYKIKVKIAISESSSSASSIIIDVLGGMVFLRSSVRMPRYIIMNLDRRFGWRTRIESERLGVYLRRWRWGQRWGRTRGERF